MSLSSWLGLRRLASTGKTAQRRRGLRQNRLHVELLEDRCVPASGLSAALVADIVPGAGSSNPYDLTNLDGTLYFRTDDAVNGMQLWKSDGTDSGTTFVKTLNTPRLDINLRAMNGSVFFVDGVSEGLDYESLWKTDGTPGGASLLRTMAANNLTPINGKLFFTGADFTAWTIGAELWVSDGTAAGTVLLKDIYAGTTNVWYPSEHGSGKVKSVVANNSSPSELTNLNGTLLFAATDGKGRELWKSDGTAAGTTLVKNIASGSASSNPQNLTVVGDFVYFVAAGGLWKTNGTSAGTVLVKNIVASNLTNVNGALYFVGSDATNGAELWKSDGTPTGTVLVKDIVAGATGANPQSLTNVNGTLFFSAGDGANGRELWKSNGTAAGTVLVMDINAGVGSSVPAQLTNVNGLLYFTASDGVNGNELWQSNGTAAGTQLVRDIYPGSGSSDSAYLTSMNNKLYFAATDPEHGRELWDPPPVEPSQEYLLVAEYDNQQVLRYDGTTGAFVDQFIAKHSGGLKEPQFLVFGPHDHNLYVGSGHFGGPLKAVLRYDGTTGAFMGEFTESGRLNSVHGVLFGPDGNLYVGDNLGYENGQQAGGRIVRFDGRTGAFLDEFVSTFSGGLRHPFGMVFAPDSKGKLDLYVADGPGNVLRYDGSTGAFLGEFVPLGSGGLDLPIGLSFGPDGSLYVADLGFRTGNPMVLRYQGPTGPLPGAFIDAFVPPGRGGLLDVQAAIFGPDGNGDGRQDLYVSNGRSNGIGQDKGTKGNVKRYDGVTGAFIDTFIAIGSGGLNHSSGMTFTKTDPMTLAYRGGDRLTAASLPALTTSETLAANAAQPLLNEAIVRWQAAGVDISAVSTIDIRIADLGGTTLGLASGHTVWLDDNAAGWGWFVDSTPWDDSEFTTPGNQGEQNRMDLLTVLAHEIGHLLGQEHGEDGVMIDTLATGMRRLPDSTELNDWSAILDVLVSGSLSKRRW